MPFGMRGLWGPSIEAFYRRGLLNDISTLPQPPANSAKAAGGAGGKGGKGGGIPQPRPVPSKSSQQLSGPAGHFAGITFDYDNIDTTRAPWKHRLQGPADTQLGLPMEHIERVLTTRALSMGVEIRRGHAIDALDASTEDVTVSAGDQHFRSRWLVGCDGGRSKVRKLGGFEFVGTEPEFTAYSMQVELADAEKLPGQGRHYTATGVYTQWASGMIAVVDYDGGVLHRSQSIDVEHVQAVLRRVTCTDVTVKALNAIATWTDRSKQATTYRKGRILLAGDSAHIHSPLGGQGLNLGLGDALNLGWKLAATIRGDAPDGLLDTYTAERHPIGARILDWTRAQVTLMRPNLHSRALASIVRDLMNTRDGAAYFAERLWGVTLRYDMNGGGSGSSDIVSAGNEKHSSFVVGRTCPDFEFLDGTRVGTLLQEGKGLLLEFDSSKASLGALDGLWGDRVKYVRGEVKDSLGLSAVLVRPDGFVVWASAASEATPSVEDVQRAGLRWFVGREPQISSGQEVTPTLRHNLSMS